jgi:hypothetical protein
MLLNRVGRHVAAAAGVVSELGLKSIPIDDVANATGALRTLHLRGCGIGEDGFEALGIGLAQCTTLTELR